MSPFKTGFQGIGRRRWSECGAEEFLIEKESDFGADFFYFYSDYIFFLLFFVFLLAFSDAHSMLVFELFFFSDFFFVLCLMQIQCWC